MDRVPLPESWRGRAIVIGNAELSDDWFTADEIAIAASLRLPKRIAEWKLSRIAAKQLALDLGLCAAPRECTVERPWLRVAGAPRHVSISHSGPYAGAAISVEPIGIDVERVRHLSESAAHLFLADAEERAMRNVRLADAIIHFWAAKEAAWKKRGGTIETLKRVPIRLEAETKTGLRFDDVETFATGDLVVALTRPTGAAGSWRR